MRGQSHRRYFLRLAEVGGLTECGVGLWRDAHAVGPAVVAAAVYGREHVGRDVVASTIALVHRGPQNARAWIHIQPHCVAQPAREDVPSAPVVVELHDSGATWI